MRLTPDQKEVIELLIEAAEGAPSAEQCARMHALVRGDEAMQSFLLSLLHQEAWLSLNCLHESSKAGPEAITAKIRKLLVADGGIGAPPKAATLHPEERSVADHALQQGSGPQIAPVSLGPRRNRTTTIAVERGLLAACAAGLLGIGVTIGVLARLPDWYSIYPPNVAETAPRDSYPNTDTKPAYQARLVQYTSCVWGREPQAKHGGGLSSGDALKLVYGLADLELRWDGDGTAKVRLEGPAGMVLMNDGGVNLDHGKLTANVGLPRGRFGVETPHGRVEVAGNAKIGVAVSSKAAELHVFEGDAEFIMSWAPDSNSSDTINVPAGQSIKLATAESGAIQIRRGGVRPDFFVTEIAMSDDLLDLPVGYASAIREAAPICYWRFNAAEDGLIRNEMGDRYHGRVLGNAEWVEESGNWTMQLGGWFATDSVPAHVIADRPLEGKDVPNYSLEVWVKPSHVHLGTVAALLNPDEDLVGGHGMLLEVGGPLAIDTGMEQPGRIRYMHRNPPIEFGGVSCFSRHAYGLRKWQHVVATKDSTHMRLYVDGREVAAVQESTPLANDLLLLIGQLDQQRSFRLYIGQVDELAFYERTLSEDEIQKHYRIVRPVRQALPNET